MLPLLRSVSGDKIRIRRVMPCAQGLLRMWLGFAFRTSPAVIGPVCSSTYPFRCTILIKSRAPHGRTQAKQHLKLLPIIVGWIWGMIGKLAGIILESVGDARCWKRVRSGGKCFIAANRTRSCTCDVRSWLYYFWNVHFRKCPSLLILDLVSRGQLRCPYL